MNGTENVLEEKRIYITGARRMENGILARFLEERTGVRCEAVLSDQVEAMDRVCPPSGSRLFLMDVLDRRLREALAQRPPRTNGSQSALSGLYFRLYQNGLNGGSAAPDCLCGFIYRCDSPERFVQAIQSLLSGHHVVLAEAPVCYFLPGANQDHEEGHPLSPREFHTLFLMAEGLSNIEIAACLHISSHTVRTHLYNIFRKIRVKSRVQASLWVHEHVERFFLVD